VAVSVRELLLGKVLPPVKRRGGRAAGAFEELAGDVFPPVKRRGGSGFGVEDACGSELCAREALLSPRAILRLSVSAETSRAADDIYMDDG
jgi:hypothetical protein